MKYLISALIVLFSYSSAYAEKCYVFIQKIDHMEKGMEAGRSSIGDVVEIVPYTPQYKPTKNETSYYDIIVVDLTEQDKIDLKKPKYTEDKTTPLLYREKRIDVKSLNLTTQEENVTKSKMLQSVVNSDISAISTE